MMGRVKMNTARQLQCLSVKKKKELILRALAVAAGIFGFRRW
jgi:hypothetical protein